MLLRLHQSDFRGIWIAAGPVDRVDCLDNGRHRLLFLGRRKDDVGDAVDHFGGDAGGGDVRIPLLEPAGLCHAKRTKLGP